ncbi:MAG: hypothetical protein L6R45_29615 [Anaerolineae bacterium]|nr:hypothetical protein [Anaerolineae bacterium]
MTTTIITQKTKNSRGETFTSAPPHPCPPAAYPSRRARATHFYDPWERLLAAIALQAVKDIVRPGKMPWFTPEERETAYWFVGHFPALYTTLGIPRHKINLLLTHERKNRP